MIKHVSTTIGAAIIGAMGFAIWPVLWQTFGVMGGYLASVLVVTVMFYMNHWCGIMHNEEGAAWVDMAWGIAIAGITWGLVKRDMDVNFAKCLPTLVIAICGGIAGGIMGEAIKKHHPAFQKPTDETTKEAE
ncbi:MAG: electron transporter RnfD [Kiritimatiellia bacterium]|jgi:hypothetical protein|nr:electron transporter RnfD [Kiritimatiellia bacterium]